MLLLLICLSLSSTQTTKADLLGSLSSAQTTETDIREYVIPTDGTLRETVLGVSDYGCGRRAFCDTSLANYSYPYCFKCPGCQCDSMCHFYGDCCPDALFQTPNMPSEISPDISCQPYDIKWRGEDPPPTVFMVTSCPANTTADNETKLRCEQPSNYVTDEATAVSAGNVTYRNMFCAICGEKLHFTRYEIQAVCEVSDFLSSVNDRTYMWRLVVDHPKCAIYTVPPSSSGLRRCQNDIVDACNVTGLWNEYHTQTEQLCGMYYHPVTLLRTKYKNIFCAVCNGALLSRDQDRDKCRPRIIRPGTFRYPLSVLIDFNPKTQVFAAAAAKVYRTRKTCNASYIFDPFTEECQKIRCSFARTLVDGRCEPTFQSSTGLGYSGSIQMTYQEQLPIAKWEELLLQLTSKMKLAMGSYDPFTFPRINATLHRSAPHDLGLNVSEKVTGASVHFQFISLHNGFQLKLEEDLRKIHSVELNFSHEGENRSLLSYPLQCHEPTKIIQTLGFFPLIETADQLCRTIQYFDSCTFQGVPFYPVLSVMDCPYQEYDLQTSNFTFEPEYSSLEIYNQTFNLSKHEYWICGNVLKICTSALTFIEDNLVKPNISRGQNKGQINVNTPTTRSLAEFIVSTVCVSLSLVCLLLTFIVYCWLPELRTIAAKNTMLLVAYLFCAQLLFLVGIQLKDSQILCRAFGVIIHYLWVATFTATGVCAYHMHSVFTQISSPSFSERTSHSEAIVRNVFIINLVAAVVVGVCISYHAGISGGSDIGYGDNICFLDKPLDIGVFFAGPLAVILIINTIFFVRVIRAIHRVPDMESAKNQTNQNHVNVYFRLSVLLGFTWIFGFIATASQLEVLWFVFDALSGLQGVFIFVACCLTKATRKHVDLKCHCCLSMKYKPSERSSSSGGTRSSSSSNPG